MLGSGAIRKITVGDTIIYRIGDLQISSPVLISELECLLGRMVILKVEEGIPLKRTHKEHVAPYDRNG